MKKGPTANTVSPAPMLDANMPPNVAWPGIGRKREADSDIAAFEWTLLSFYDFLVLGVLGLRHRPNIYTARGGCSSAVCISGE
jgi:hypothetical protein